MTAMLSPAALAQTAATAASATAPAPAAAQARDGADNGDDDIVVMARRREESIQKVPLAISAFSGPELRNKGVQSLQDIGRFTPGLNAMPHTTSASVVQFNMRGQSSGDVLTTVDQPVGVYVDGVYISRARGLNAAFFDLQRVEVLKGPQGTLYGRNTTGGAISIFTRSADFDGLHGFIGGQFGQYGLVDFNGAINIPIVADILSVRIAADGIKRRGFGKSAITNQRLGQDRNQQTVRASILFQPTDTLSFDLKGQLYRARENNNLVTLRYVIPTGTGLQEATIERTGIRPNQPGYAAAAAATLTYLQGLAALGASDFFTSYIDTPQTDNNDVRNIGLTTKWDLTDAITLKSITGYRHFLVKQTNDADATPIDVLTIGVGDAADGGDPLARGKTGGLSSNFTIPFPNGQNNKFFSQELNMGGAALDDRLTWLVGAFYSNEHGQDIQQSRFTPALVPQISINDGYRVFTKNWSIFTQNDFKVTDQLSVTAGIRYTHDHKGLVSRLANFNPATGLFTCGTGVLNAGGTNLVTSDRANCERGNEKTFTGTSYLGSINYQLNPDVLFYVRTARSFRSGSFQLRLPAQAPANPETATDYEVGMKADFFDRLLRVNAAAFQTKYKGKQETVFVTTAAGTLATVIQNAADATLKGFEAEVRLHPVTGLTFNGTVAYLRGVYDHFPGALPIGGGTAVDASGERFATPPWTYTLGGRYEIPTAAGDLGFQLDWSWTAGARPPARLLNPGLPAALVDQMVANPGTGSYANGRASLGLMNGRIDFKLPDPNLTIALFATNLLNHHYQMAQFDPSSLGGFFGGHTGAPRMIGVQVKLNFGNE